MAVWVGAPALHPAPGALQLALLASPNIRAVPVVQAVLQLVAAVVDQPVKTPQTAARVQQAAPDPAAVAAVAALVV